MKFQVNETYTIADSKDIIIKIIKVQPTYIQYEVMRGVLSTQGTGFTPNSIFARKLVKINP